MHLENPTLIEIEQANRPVKFRSNLLTETQRIAIEPAPLNLRRYSFPLPGHVKIKLENEKYIIAELRLIRQIETRKLENQRNFYLVLMTGLGIATTILICFFTIYFLNK